MPLEAAAWYTVRRAANTKPSTYRCPFCERRFPALEEHVLVAPLGDTGRRRHAHTACALRARAAGRLPLRDEAESRGPGILARLRARLGARASA